MKNLIDKYIESKEYAWSESSKRSERSRLRSVMNRLDDCPKALYLDLETTKSKSSVKSIFMRIKTFYQWGIDEGHFKSPNKYDEFMRSHKRLFRGSESRRPGVTFNQATERLLKLDPETRVKALDLLMTGSRYTESFTENDQGVVVGKGGKQRKLFRPSGTEKNIEYTKHYSTFWRKLKKVGLRPHDLRKLRATNWAENGANLADLLELGGWASAQTAMRYWVPKREEELQEIVNG